jgi:hypothetical protein
VDQRTPCLFPDCGRRVLRFGLCPSHYNQQRVGEELRPIRAKRANRTVGTNTCLFGSCEAVDWKRGYCRQHYEQLAKGRPLKSVKVYKPGGIPAQCVRDAAGRKRCPQCGEWRAESEYHRSSNEPDGLFYCCKGCARQNGRAAVYRRYSITAEQYDAMLAAQGGVCAVCAQECSRGHLSVDHDHACCPGEKSCGKCIRGLLCRSCNQALGHMKDDADRLEAAARYLRMGLVALRTPQ